MKRRRGAHTLSFSIVRASSSSCLIRAPSSSACAPARARELSARLRGPRLRGGVMAVMSSARARTGQVRKRVGNHVLEIMQTCASVRAATASAAERPARSSRARSSAAASFSVRPATFPSRLATCWRRVLLVRRDGRDVSTLYGREGGGGSQPVQPAPPCPSRGARAAPAPPRPPPRAAPRALRAPPPPPPAPVHTHTRTHNPHFSPGNRNPLFSPGNRNAEKTHRRERARGVRSGAAPTLKGF